MKFLVIFINRFYVQKIDEAITCISFLMHTKTDAATSSHVTAQPTDVSNKTIIDASSSEPILVASSSEPNPDGASSSEPILVASSIPNQQCQPRNIIFPKKTFGRTSERYYSMQPSWFDTWKWLHWDSSKEAVLCHTCVQAMEAGKLIFSRNTESSFLSKGFQNWKDATRLFRAHELSKCHKEAVEKIVRLRATTPHVGEMLFEGMAKEKKENREMLLHILRAVQFLARQGLALRGKTEVSSSSSEPDSNLCQMLSFVGGFDERMTKWLQRKNNKYTSPDISNEILQTMALTIVRNISSSIRGRKFTVMIDETTDCSTTEQCVICLRWVDQDLVPHEELIGFHDCPETNADYLVRIIKDVLLRLNLSFDDCRGQCYDGAAVMQGCRNGVAKQIRSIQPKAIYTHCYIYALNLACQDTIRNIKPLRDALDTAFELSKLLKYSAKRKAEYTRLKEELAPAQPGFRNLCPTRWTVRAKSLKSILDNYQLLQRSLETFSTFAVRDPEMSARCAGISAQFDSFDFLFGVTVGSQLLSVADNLSTTLQSKSMSVADA